MVKFFVFSWLFLAKDTNGESFCFFDHFWPRIPTVEDLVGLGHFWPRIPMVKVLVGLSHFWLRLPTVKVFVFHGYFCPSLLLLATLAVNTNDVSYVCDLRFVFEQPLGSRSAKRVFAFAVRQSLAPHCASRSLCSGRQLLAWD